MRRRAPCPDSCLRARAQRQRLWRLERRRRQRRRRRGSLNAPGLYGKLPPAGTPTHGGTITYGVLNGNTPNYIFPIVPSSYASTYNYNVQQAMWLPIYNNSAYGTSPGIDYR